LLGPPASGKGTQSVRLSRYLGVPHVSSGHLLRRSMAEGDPLGVRPLVSAGRKVPDEVVQELLRPALSDGFVLDGYPRTTGQVRWLDDLTAKQGRDLDAAVELVLDEETLVARMMLRADAERRTDDRPDVFLHRLEEYRKDIPALREAYRRRLITIDGAGSEDEVFERLLEAIRRGPAGSG
jgi:adenylate kinase